VPDSREAMDRLIDRLAADARPVRRLKPPVVRALYWLLTVAAVAAVAVAAFANMDVFMERARDPKLALELTGTVLTGILAVIAAFQLSLPDRSPAWALLPLPPLVLWLASSGYNCWRHWIVYGPDGWALGESTQCFRFIILVSIPLAGSLIYLLRKACPLTPIRVALIGGLGVAALSAFVLQFFHPFDVTFMDLGVHLVAIGIVGSAAALVEGVAQRRAAHAV
jgi:hypothetical protein